MSLLDATLQEIAAAFQLPKLAFNNKGTLSLQLGEADILSFEKSGDGVLFSVARPLPLHREGLGEKVLRLCGDEGGLPIAVRAGLSKNNHLVLSVFFTERTFIVPEFMRCLTTLREAHARIAAL